MIKDCSITKSTMVFKMNIVKLLNKYQKLKKQRQSLDFMKNYFKIIKEICKGNARESKQRTTKCVLNSLTFYLHIFDCLSSLCFLKPILKF